MHGDFHGFSTKTFAFLKELKSNNNRPWFNENKPRYEADVLETSLQFITAMKPALKKVTRYFDAIPKRTGGSLMRIYRDVRFSKDKIPYKTNIGIHFRHEMGKSVHSPGYYLHLEPNECFFGAGIWHPDNDTLRKIRSQIVDQPQRWKRIARNKKLKQDFEFAGDSLKRPPRDFDPDHPLIEDLKRKDFIILQHFNQKYAQKPALVDQIAEKMKQARPLMVFLCDSLRIPF